MGSSNDSVSFNKSVIKNYIDELKEISDFDDSNILKSVLSLPNSLSKGYNFDDSHILKSLLSLPNSISEAQSSNKKNN